MAAKQIAETEYAVVVPNRTRYDLWEGHSVAEHYLVVPKQCAASLQDLSSDAARLDIMNLIAHYEKIGFNVYARAVGSPRRSVAHQHTHLIKFTDQPRRKVVLYMEKPYAVLTLQKPWVLRFKKKSKAVK
ncbi:MAG: hypothetical protein WBP26_02950 [Candidatus Saccharimonadales bacterium]